MHAVLREGDGAHAARVPRDVESELQRLGSAALVEDLVHGHLAVARRDGAARVGVGRAANRDQVAVCGDGGSMLDRLLGGRGGGLTVTLTRTLARTLTLTLTPTLTPALAPTPALALALALALACLEGGAEASSSPPSDHTRTCSG